MQIFDKRWVYTFAFSSAISIALQKRGQYYNYKLALALNVGSPRDKLYQRILDRLLLMQDPNNGGFVTLSTEKDGPCGAANVETTSHALLALNNIHQKLIK